MQITVEERSVYGKLLYYPVNSLAIAIAKVAKVKTLSISDLTSLRDIGLEIVVQHPKCEIGGKTC